MDAPRFRTLHWTGAALDLLDQRRLPDELAYVRCASAVEVAEAIRAMVIRGAPAIGCAAAYGMALAALASDAGATSLERARAMLAASRPTAVNLFWALERMSRIAGSHRGPGLGQRLLAEAESIAAEDVAANRAMGEHGAALLPGAARVLTHCNAGALATAGHGTALGIVRSAVAAGKRVHVYADETRPFLQGARLTAWELAQDGIPVTILADVAAASLLARGSVDAVVVGADRVAANGDVANKVGTYPLAVLAARHAVPFYVACPIATIDPQVAHGRDIPIEERDGSEVRGFGPCVWAPAEASVYNPVFDVTPAALVTALVTEHGVVQRPCRASIEALLAAARRAR